MYVSYVIYNLDDSHDLELLRLHKTAKQAIGYLNQYVKDEADTLDYPIEESSEGSAISYSTDYERLYGYDFVEEDK